MGALDISTIILATLAIVASLINAIVWLVKSKRQQETYNDKSQWDLINKLVSSIVKKQENTCKSLEKVRKELKEINEKFNQKNLKQH